MNKGDLIKKLAEDTGMSMAQVDRFVDTFIDTVQTAVAAGDKVTLPGFGAWSRTQRSARTARNPRTGDLVQVPASMGVKFSAGAKFKAAVK